MWETALCCQPACSSGGVWQWDHECPVASQLWAASQSPGEGAALPAPSFHYCIRIFSTSQYLEMYAREVNFHSALKIICHTDSMMTFFDDVRWFFFSTVSVQNQVEGKHQLFFFQYPLFYSLSESQNYRDVKVSKKWRKCFLYGWERIEECEGERRIITVGTQRKFDLFVFEAGQFH